MGYNPGNPFDPRNAPLIFSMLGERNGGRSPHGGGSGCGWFTLGCAVLLFFALLAVMLFVGFHG